MAFFTSRGAPIHLHFSGLPIDLWIMVLEPCVAEDHALLPEVRDGKERPFGVGLIMEDYIHHFGDLSCFIRGAVHVEHRYGTRDAPGTNTFCTDKILVYEVAGGSRVQKRFDGMHLAGVGGTDLYRQDDRRSTGVEGVGRESSGEFFFPFGPPRQGCPDWSGGERGSASIGSRISVLTSSTSNTVNLLTSSDRGALFAGRAKQNPPPGRSQLPLLLLHLSRPSNLQSILPVAPRLTSGRLDGRDSPL